MIDQRDRRPAAELNFSASIRNRKAPRTSPGQPTVVKACGLHPQVPILEDIKALAGGNICWSSAIGDIFQARGPRRQGQGPARTSPMPSQGRLDVLWIDVAALQGCAVIPRRSLLLDYAEPKGRAPASKRAVTGSAQRPTRRRDGLDAQRTYGQHA